MRTEKLRVSSKFIIPKSVLIFLILLFLIGAFQATNPEALKGSLIISILLALVLYCLFIIPDIYYDADTLYIVKGEKVKKEIALDSFQSITFSGIGVIINGRYSYQINILTAIIN